MLHCIWEKMHTNSSAPSQVWGTVLWNWTLQDCVDFFNKFLSLVLFAFAQFYLILTWPTFQYSDAFISQNSVVLHSISFLQLWYQTVFSNWTYFDTIQLSVNFNQLFRTIIFYISQKYQSYQKTSLLLACDMSNFCFVFL